MASEYPGLEHIREGASAETQYLLNLLDAAYAELQDKRQEVDRLVSDMQAEHAAHEQTLAWGEHSAEQAALRGQELCEQDVAIAFLKEQNVVMRVLLERLSSAALDDRDRLPDDKYDAHRQYRLLNDAIEDTRTFLADSPPPVGAQRQRERTWPAALTLKVEIATGGYFEFVAPAATIAYERGEEVQCSSAGCHEPPTVNRTGVWYCAPHAPDEPSSR